MAGPSWLVDKSRIATKIKCASSAENSGTINWKSNPTRSCPNCQHNIHNDDVTQDWPGLPRGVKFDPSDQEIIWHLLAKNGVGGLNPHAFIDEFIPTVDGDEGICYTHPQNLPGVTQDGSASHFFHQAIKAYSTGTRKRRKIHGDDSGDVRWHKTGRTKPVMLDGVQKGCKKIMVLYVSPMKGCKAEKTNWVMHQYHLGTEEEEKDGQFLISKVFYQQQQVSKQGDKVAEDIPDLVDNVAIAKVDPVTPKSVTPEPPYSEKRAISDQQNYSTSSSKVSVVRGPDLDMVLTNDVHEQDIRQEADNSNDNCPETHIEQADHNNDVEDGENPKWWDSESQYLLNSQQLVEALSLCDDLLQSQSPNRDGNGIQEPMQDKPRLSHAYAQLGAEDLKKDLEECQDLVLDPTNIEMDTPPDFRLSQLDFGSQDSYFGWGGSKVTD